MVGLMSAVTGGAFLATQIFPRDYIFVAIAIWMCSGFGMAWGAKRLRERITYPRGGYVALNEQSAATRRRSRRVALILVFAGMALLTALFPRMSHFFASGVAGSALFVSIYMFSGVKYRRPDLLCLAGFCALLGVWAYAGSSSMAFILFWQGVGLATIGAIRLWRFIKSHPRPVETEA